MRFYESAEAEAGAIARAVAVSGCRIRSLLPSGHVGAHTRGRVDCPDGWHAAALLLALAREDARTPGARRLAAMLRTEAPSDAAYRAAVHSFVKRNVRFAPEEGEIFQNGGYTLTSGVGDCDDHARLVVALYLAGGLAAEIGYLHGGRNPTHASPRGCVDGACEWAETTVDARIGEHPIDAALRLGVVKERGDLSGQEEVIMGSEMAKAPRGYLKANPPELVRRDVEALGALGFLADCAEVKDAADPVFREAILAVQMAAAPEVTRDGLVGPQTRGVIAGMLEERGMGELAAGYLGDRLTTPRPVASTADLSDGFFRRVVAMNARFVARGAKTKPEHWIAVWNGESGLYAHPPVPIEKRVAGGLNGILFAFLPKLGFPGTPAEFESLSAEEQMPFVERFYESITGFLTSPGGQPDFALLDSPEAIYAWNFLPAYVQRLREERPIFASRDNDGQGFYKHNQILDQDNDGVIDLADLRTWVARQQRNAGARWIEARRRMHETPGGNPGPSVPAIVATIATVATIGAAFLAGSRLG